MNACGRFGLSEIAAGIIKSPVTFRDTSMTRDGVTVTIPAPDPDLMALHATCAKVAHASGAAEYLEELYRNTGSFAVMTEPNAAHELTRILKTVQVRPAASSCL